MAPVGITHIGAEGRDLDFRCVTRNKNNAKLSAHADAFGKERHDAFRRGVGGDIEVRGLAAEQQIAHTAAYEQRLMAVAAERVADRVGKFAGRHIPIIRQLRWKRERSVVCSVNASLFAAEDEAGYVIGLARGADKFVYGLHEELKAFLRA
jgi:hypothetical protein